MKEQLIKLLDNAYAPYSNFKVAAIVKMRDGRTFGGVNVENASNGASVCAERHAIANAITNGYKKGDFESLSLISNSNRITYPCFICRQVMLEFLDDECDIILYSENEFGKILKVKDLTPYPFNEKDLIV